MSAVTYTLDPKLLVQGHKWVWTKGVWFPLMVTLPIFLAFGLFDRPNWEGRVTAFAVAAACLAMAWGAWIVWLPSYAKRRFNTLSSLRIPYTMTWRDSRMTWVSEDSRREYDPRQLRRWSEREDCVLLLTTDNMLWMIPKRAFSSPRDLDDLRSYLAGIRAPT